MALYLEKDSGYEVELVKLSFKERLLWTWRIWFGYKARLKLKIKKNEVYD